MASNTIGRTDCPVKCGHTAAFVKLKTDKEAGKTAYPYVHCAGCGVQLHTRSQAQAEHLLAITRGEKGAEAAQDAQKRPPSGEQSPADTETPPPPKKAPGGFLAGGILGMGR